jgi:autotransporter-associated beta strand protein
LAAEGATTDIMTTGATNTATNIGINMSTLSAAGGVGLSLGGIEFNKSVTSNLQIGNSSTTVNGILQLNGATINSVAKTLVRVSGSSSLTIANVNSGTGTQTMGLRLGITDGIFDVDTSRTLTISSIISEATVGSGFTKTGAGNLTLAGANTFTGAVTVDGGNLVINNYAALDLNSSLITVGGGSAGINIQQVGTGATSDSYSQNLSLNGSLRSTGGSGTNTLALTWSGDITLTGNSTFNANGNTTIDIDGDVDLGANTLTFQTDGSRGGNRIDGAISGTGGLIKTSGNTLVLSGANLYTGTTTVDAGTLRFTNQNSLYNSNSANWTAAKINVLSGASLALNVDSAGSSGFTSTSLDTLLGNISVANSASEGLQAGAVIGIDTGTATGSSFTQGNSITDSTGVSGGAITLNKLGAGTLVLDKANTHTGNTIISAGAINAQHANALGGTAGTTTVASNAALILQGGISFAAEPLTLTASTSGSTLLRNASGNNTWTGPITTTVGGTSFLTRIESQADLLTVSGSITGTSSNSLVFQGAGNITVSGQITGAAGLISGSNGAGVRTLSNDANDYTGATGVSGGTLAFTSIADGGVASALGAATTSTAINLGSSTTSGTLKYVGTAVGGHSSDRVVNLNGTTGNGTIEASGSGPLVLTSGVTAAGGGVKTLTLAGTNSGNNSIGAISEASALSAVSVTKSGSGTWTMTGTSGYTGTTDIDEGKLIINGNISTSTLTTVASGATIGGGGTVGQLTVESAGFITPGNSTGILTVDGNYTQAGTYTAEIDGLTPGTLHDRINVNGSVDITSGSLVTLFAGSYSINDLIVILANDGADAITGTYSGLAQGAIAATFGGFQWQISYLADSTGNTFTGGNDIALMAVPEPNVGALLGGLGTVMLLRRRRH